MRRVKDLPPFKQRNGKLLSFKYAKGSGGGGSSGGGSAASGSGGGGGGALVLGHMTVGVLGGHGGWSKPVSLAAAAGARGTFEVEGDASGHGGGAAGACYECTFAVQYDRLHVIF